jgi:hypothetical protein
MNRSAHAFKLAGAAALAGSTQAYGQIVLITPSNLPSNITGYAPTYPAPLVTETYDVSAGETNGGTPDFSFHYWNSSYFYAGTGKTYSTFYTSVANLKMGAAIASSFQGTPFLYADAISAGTKIGSDTLNFYQPTRLVNPVTYLTYTYQGATVNGLQQPNTPTYLGFQFTGADSQIHDGWLELESETYTSPSSPGGLIFLGGAYNSVADPGADSGGVGDIFAGEVPEPGTISSLMLGAAALVGVGLMRRRRASLVIAQD